MTSFFPGAIMAFREGLEAFLILILIIRFLDKAEGRELKKYAYFGFAASIVLSILLGLGLFLISRSLHKIDEFGKLWESGASILALILVSTFIIWMIRHGNEIKRHVEEKTALNLSAFGIFILAFMLVAREGVEIVIFSFAGEYNVLSILSGLGAALILALLIYFALFKISISVIFKATLAYLIVQAGYLLGYGLHELLSSLKSLNLLESGHPLLIKVFDLSGGALDHKEGFPGIVFNVVLGWYSKPEWLQFAAQYIYTAGFFTIWAVSGKKRKSELSA